MKKHTYVTLASVVFNLLLFGCGNEGPPPLDANNPETSVNELRTLAASRSDAVSRDTQKFAPEMLLAGAFLLEQVPQAAAESDARALIARADRYFLEAKEIADRVTQKRTLNFPEDHSLGQISVATWGTMDWHTLGEAQGVVSIEPEMVVGLSIDRAIADEDIDSLVQLGAGAIQYLALSDDADGCLARIGDMVGLRDLSLAGATVSDTSLEHIANCIHLRHLNLMGIDLDDEKVARFSTLPALQDLAIESDAISDRGLFHVSQLPELKSLVVRRCSATDVGIDFLSRSTRLERLWLYGSRITDFAVPTLEGLEDLDELILLETSITRSGIHALEDALPDCRIDAVS